MGEERIWYVRSPGIEHHAPTAYITKLPAGVLYNSVSQPAQGKARLLWL